MNRAPRSEDWWRLSNKDNLCRYCLKSFETAQWKKSGVARNWTQGLWLKRPVLCHWATTPTINHASFLPSGWLLWYCSDSFEFTTHTAIITYLAKYSVFILCICTTVVRKQQSKEQTTPMCLGESLPRTISLYTFCKLKGDSPFLETTGALGSLVIVGLVVLISAVVTPVRLFPESALAFLDFFPMIWFTQSRYGMPRLPTRKRHKN